MLMIRLQRVGRKNIPTYRVVLTDSRNSTKSGKFLEVLGFYDPINKKDEVNAERVKHWISKGAKTSETMHNYLINKKIISGKKVNVLPRKSPVKPASTEASGKEEAAAEAPKEAPVETPAEPQAETK